MVIPQTCWHNARNDVVLSICERTELSCINLYRSIFNVAVDQINSLLHLISVQKARLIRRCKKSSPHPICQFHCVLRLCHTRDWNIGMSAVNRPNRETTVSSHGTMNSTMSEKSAVYIV